MTEYNKTYVFSKKDDKDAFDTLSIILKAVSKSDKPTHGYQLDHIKVDTIQGTTVATDQWRLHIVKDCFGMEDGTYYPLSVSKSVIVLCQKDIYYPDIDKLMPTMDVIEAELIGLTKERQDDPKFYSAVIKKTQNGFNPKFLADLPVGKYNITYATTEDRAPVVFDMPDFKAFRAVVMPIITD